MPVYSFKCENCGHRQTIVDSIINCPEWNVQCQNCPEYAHRDLQEDSPGASAFKPYVEENFDGQDREVTSGSQRDQLCKQFGVTYDSAARSQSRQVGTEPTVSDKMVKEILDETQGGKILPKDVQEACQAASTDD